MAESMFDIFGRHTRGDDHKHVDTFRTPSKMGFENFSTPTAGPFKPTEIPKKIDSVKKSFLSNKGAVLQNTPSKPFSNIKNTILNVNQSLKIYSDEPQKSFAVLGTNIPMKKIDNIKIEKHKTSISTYDNYNNDWFDSDPYLNIEDEDCNLNYDSPYNPIDVEFKMTRAKEVTLDFMKFDNDDDSFDEYVNKLEMPVLSDDSF